MVLVTGASRGVGRATAKAFAAAGAKVALNYHNRTDAAQAVLTSLEGEGHTLHQVDIANATAVEQMVDKIVAAWGHIDVLVNNAAIYQSNPLQHSNYDDWQAVWQRTLAVNLVGAANVTYCVAQQMIKQGQGRIINITSGPWGAPDYPAYAASKAGLNALSQTLAQDLAPHNILVTALAPGWIDTDMGRTLDTFPNSPDDPGQSPLGRVAQPEDVAEAILMLASDQSGFLTGGIVDFNGALYLRP